MGKTAVIVMALCVIAVTGCTGKGGRLDLRKPATLDLEPPPGPPEYRQGWSDGCESGMDAYAPQFQKLVRAFDLKQDPKLRNNPVYYRAWKDAFLYCAMYWESITRIPV